MKRTIADERKATIWFLVRAEKNIPALIKAAAIRITPKYEIITSTIPRWETTDKEIGKLRVNVTPIAANKTKPVNFESTILSSDKGSVNKVSIVFNLFSSENERMVMAGIKTKNSQGTRPKNGLMDADPTAKISLTNKKLAKTANSMGTMYPTGVLK